MDGAFSVSPQKQKKKKKKKNKKKKKKKKICFHTTPVLKYFLFFII
jgi:hypothetical protein